jgi:hypothetical protein
MCGGCVCAGSFACWRLMEDWGIGGLEGREVGVFVVHAS